MILLTGFVVLSVMLIALILGENLSAKEPGRPGYYRDTFVVDENVHATSTADALRNAP